MANIGRLLSEQKTNWEHRKIAEDYIMAAIGDWIRNVGDSSVPAFVRMVMR